MVSIWVRQRANRSVVVASTTASNFRHDHELQAQERLAPRQQPGLVAEIEQEAGDPALVAGINNAAVERQQALVAQAGFHVGQSGHADGHLDALA